MGDILNVGSGDPLSADTENEIIDAVNREYTGDGTSDGPMGTTSTPPAASPCLQLYLITTAPTVDSDTKETTVQGYRIEASWANVDGDGYWTSWGDDDGSGKIRYYPWTDDGIETIYVPAVDVDATHAAPLGTANLPGDHSYRAWTVMRGDRREMVSVILQTLFPFALTATLAIGSSATTELLNLDGSDSGNAGPTVYDQYFQWLGAYDAGNPLVSSSTSQGLYTMVGSTMNRGFDSPCKAVIVSMRQQARRISGTTSGLVTKSTGSFSLTPHSIVPTDGGIIPPGTITVTNPGFCIDSGATCYCEWDSAISGYRVYDAPCSTNAGC